ncbi:class E sortase [Rubrobacter calidifluminis]|uniref:class E sortase n=1 Tax=Rubrobacter calidifluminis TaxID=1392640 RepID=UPI002361ABFA|nr:class E sortase [Rubrobacter calidifluminis]
MCGRSHRTAGRLVLAALAAIVLLVAAGCGQDHSAQRSHTASHANTRHQVATPGHRVEHGQATRHRAAHRVANKEHPAARHGKVHEKKQARKGGKKPSAAVIKSPPSDPTLYLTIPRLGIYGDTVANTDSEAVMNQEAIKLPATGFPWQKGANTYIAGHRIGYAGTQSYYQFYRLPAMKPGDRVILRDADGNTYDYVVTRVFAVTPQDVSVTEPIPGQTTVTLQTCITSLNDWWTIGPAMYSSSPSLDRLIVQAKQVAIHPAGKKG